MFKFKNKFRWPSYSCTRDRKTANAKVLSKVFDINVLIFRNVAFEMCYSVQYVPGLSMSVDDDISTDSNLRNEMFSCDIQLYLAWLHGPSLLGLHQRAEQNLSLQTLL